MNDNQARPITGMVYAANYFVWVVLLAIFKYNNPDVAMSWAGVFVVPLLAIGIWTMLVFVWVFIKFRDEF